MCFSILQTCGLAVWGGGAVQIPPPPLQPFARAFPFTANPIRPHIQPCIRNIPRANALLQQAELAAAKGGGKRGRVEVVLPGHRDLWLRVQKETISPLSGKIGQARR